METVASSHGMVVREEKPELMDFVGHFRNLRNIDPTIFDFFLPEYSKNGRTFKLKEIPKDKQDQVLEEICKATGKNAAEFFRTLNSQQTTQID